jgi:8-hydroxy-5-deazaflavin:NADPH oxidoreductase
VNIAIIGVGNVGSALARAVIAAGHSVVLSSRNPEHAAKVAGDLGARAVATNVEAVDGADLVVLAVPSTSVASVIDDVGEHVTGKVLVDPTNPNIPDPTELLRGTGSVAEGIQLLAPEASVVKAFNTLFASRLTDPVVDGIALDGFYAGDDEAAKSTVAGLIGELGFRPLDAGELLAARTLELMAFLHIRLNLRNGWPFQSGWKLIGPTG